MSIIHKTKWALLELFPEQAEAERIKEAEARKQAEAEVPRSEVDIAAEELESIELVPQKKAASGAPEPEKQEEQAAEPDEPEEEGPRTHGVLELDHQARGTDLDVLCSPGQVVDITQILDGIGFFLETISGVDWIKEDEMEVIYDFSIVADKPCRVVVRTRIPRSEPEVPTISEIYPGANWHERETHEFFGITFAGHPYLVPLLLPEDADFHPLRKDFKP
jgi:NADH-quinone oxidoreductase subunit C